MNALKRRWANFALAAASLAVCYGLLEAAIRVRHALRDARRPQVMEPDRDWGWRIKPNFVFDGELKDAAGDHYPVRVETDERGFRYFGDPASTRKKIFFIGDSVTFGREVGQDKTFAHLLGQALNAEVFLYAAPGYGTLQQYFVLDRYFDEIRADLVIWQVSNNDLMNNAWDLERRSIYQGYTVRTPYWEEGRVVYRSPAHGPLMRTIGQFRSKLLQAILRRLDALFLETRPTAETTIERQIEAEGPAHAGLQRSAAVTCELLRRVKQRCGETPVLTFNMRHVPVLSDTLAGAVRAAGLTYYSGVAEATEKALAEGRVVYAEDGMHWNEAGHALCAETLAPLLREYLK